MKIFSRRFVIKNHAGFSLVEQLLVIIIISISAGLAFNTMQSGAENRAAKQVLETAKQTAHSVRIYQLDTGSLPTQSNLSELEDKGYINRSEFPHRDTFSYTFVPNGGDPSRWSVQATNGSRTLTVRNNTDQFDVTDSKGLYTNT